MGGCKKVKNGVCVLYKKWKIGGVFCVKKRTFPQRRVHYVQYQYFLFYILLIWGVRRICSLMLYSVAADF